MSDAIIAAMDKENDRLIAEIVELRAEVERLTKELEEERSLISTTMVERLRAENERLQRENAKLATQYEERCRDWVAEIERLRKGWKREADEDCKWALAEIERLERRNIELQTECAGHEETVERLRARNAALVECLLGSRCPVDYRVMVADCQQCGCTHGLFTRDGRALEGK